MYDVHFIRSYVVETSHEIDVHIIYEHKILYFVFIYYMNTKYSLISSAVWHIFIIKSKLFNYLKNEMKWIMINIGKM